MRFCTKYCAIFLIQGLMLQAQEGPILDAVPPRPRIDPSELNPKVREAAATLDALREEGTEPSAEAWRVVCEACGLHSGLRSFAAEAKPFPSQLSVSLLTHPQFAVRMGALEILEEHTGKASSFDPWDPQSAASQSSLQEWQTWADPNVKNTDVPPAVAAPIDEAKMRSLLVDLVADDVSRQERAIDSLASAGMVAVAFLEQYLHDTPQLSEGGRGQIKQAQYRLVLRETFPAEAARLARDLVYGTRDQKISALLPLPRCREKSVPILVEFLPESDSLIREAAMDALLLAGEEAVYDIVLEHLKTETDENVIHAVLRRVSPKTSAGADLITSFMSSPTEDLVVAALNALSDGKSDAGKDRLLPCLTDPRWRVRVAAIEYAGKLSIRSAEDAILKAFSDSDEFVRYAAMKAAADMNIDKAVPLITRMALADDTLLGSATEAIVRMGRPLPDELVKVLPKKSGENLLAVLRAFGKRAGHDGSQIDWSKLTETGYNSSDSRESRAKAAVAQALEIVRTLASHSDPDVSATALQTLASLLLDTRDKKLVLEALKRATPDGQIALIESMLPGHFDFRESQAASSDETEESTDEDTLFSRIVNTPPPVSEAQNAVYTAFGVPLASTSSPPTPVTPGERTWQPMEKEFHDYFTKALNQPDHPDLAFHAATQLAFGGQRRAIGELHRLLPSLEAHQRARLADFLQRDSKLTSMRSGLDLLRTLLQDESPEVRSEAVYATLRVDSPQRIALLLNEVTHPDGNLRAVDVYGYYLTNATGEARTRNTIISWCEGILARSDVREDARTLALVLLGTAGRLEHAATIQGYLASPNVWHRRAAWRSMMRLDKSAFAEAAPRIAADPSPRIRETLAAAYLKLDNDSPWRVWFSERDWDSESIPYRLRTKIFGIPENVEPILVELTRDDEPYVRLHAMLALLSNGKKVEPLALRETLAAITADDELRSLLEYFLQSAARQLSPRFAFLLEHVEKDQFDDEDWKSITRVLQPDGPRRQGLALKSFASLVQTSAPAPPTRVEDIASDIQAGSADSKTSSAPLTVYFFHKPGCKDCERVRDMLRIIQEAQPLQIEEHNVERSDGAERNQILCARFQVESSLHQLTPAVFAQGGALIKTQVTFNALQRLIEKTSELPLDDTWHRTDEQERSAAGGEIKDRFSSFSIGWVALAGLLDGINPCAFATIIFFLSYLRIARRSPREILFVGIAFISAVFLAYFAVGLGMSHLIAQLEAFSWIRTWLNRLLALVALVLAWLSFRDGLLALRGRIADSTLQLPEFLKTRIRQTIRTQTRRTHFVIAAFVSGIIISFLELACTGQVYLPTIVYMMKQGSLSAFAYLLLYNIAFVLPLILIFTLAWLGMTSDALIRFQKNHTAAIRFATAALFLALWIVLLLA